MRRIFRYASLLSLFAVFMVAAPSSSPALAAIGDLTQPAGTQGCVEINPSNTGDPCGAATYGLGIDGGKFVETYATNVYVLSGYGIEVFQKDTADPGLQDLECLDGDGSDYGSNPACTVETMMSGGGFDSGSIRFSPDGKWAFVDEDTSSAAGNELIVFSRNSTTGELTQSSCYSANGNDGAGDAVCTNLESANSNYDAGNHLAISPNGKFLFADDGYTITVFDLNDSTGALTATSCANEANVGGCPDTFPVGANSNAGMMVVSPDNKFLYFASPDANVVQWLSVNQSTGELTNTGTTDAESCIEDLSSNQLFNCAASMRGDVSEVPALAISPDAAGKYVYALSGSEYADGGIVVLARDSSTGALSQVSGAAGCATSSGNDDENPGNESGGPFPCEADPGMEEAESLVPSPDGQSMYVVTGYEGNESMIELYSDGSTGALTENSDVFASCYTSNIRDDADPFCSGYNAMDGIAQFQNGEPTVGVSPDGTGVYVTSSGDAGLAIFQREAPARYSVMGKASSSGGSVSAQSVTSGAVCNATGCSVWAGGSVTLQATPNNGYRFTGWSGGTCTGTTDPCTVSNVQASETDTAHFVRRVTVAVATGGSGEGSVAISDTSGTAPDCVTGSCTVDAGDTVTLTASPATGYRLKSWSGGRCSGTVSPCVLTNVQASETDTATFALGYVVKASLSQTDSQAGNKVSASDTAADASCSSGVCSVDPGDTVTLKATPGANFTFSGWSGGSCSGTTNPCQVKNVSANETDTASFKATGAEISGLVTNFASYGPGDSAPLLSSYSDIKVEVVNAHSSQIVAGPVTPAGGGSYTLVVSNTACQGGSQHECNIVVEKGPGAKPGDERNLIVSAKTTNERVNLAMGELGAVAVTGSVLVPPDSAALRSRISLVGSMTVNGHTTQKTVYNGADLCKTSNNICGAGNYEIVLTSLSHTEQSDLTHGAAVELSEKQGNVWVPVDSRVIGSIPAANAYRADIKNVQALQGVDPVPATNPDHWIFGQVAMLSPYAPSVQIPAPTLVPSAGYGSISVSASPANGHSPGTVSTTVDSQGKYKLTQLSTAGSQNYPYSVQVSAKKSGTKYMSFGQWAEIPPRDDPSATFLNLWFSKDGEVPLQGNILPAGSHSIKTEIVVTAQGTVVYDSLTSGLCSGPGGACSTGHFLIGVPAQAKVSEDVFKVELKEENSSGKWVSISSVNVPEGAPPILGDNGQNVPTVNAKYPVPAH